jgi:hypothetical protein
LNKRYLVSAVWPTAIGWGIGWGVTWTVDSVLAYLGIQGNLASPPLGFLLSLIALVLVIATSGVGWAVGGLNTGLVLWRNYPAFHWKHTLMTAGGWIISGVIGFPVLFVMVFALGLVSGLAISGSLAACRRGNRDPLSTNQAQLIG